MQRPIIFTIIGLCATISIEAKESVPVLIWKNEKSPLDILAVSSLHIPFSHLEEKYLQSFKPDNILLFQQDTLSVEDLSSYEGVFSHIRKLMEESHSLYLPAVEAKSSIAHTLSAHGYNIIALEPGSSVGELKLNENSKNLVLVKLPSTTTNPSRRNALQKSDEVVETVLSKIDKKANFTVMFTGKEPSVKLESDVEHRRLTRSLKQSEPRGENPIFHYTPCILLYLRNDIVYMRGNESYVLSNNATQDVLHDCRNETAVIIQYKEPHEGLTKAKLQLTFSRMQRRWTLQDAVLTLMNSESVIEVLDFYPSQPMAQIPLQKSYSCSQKLILLSNSTDKTLTSKLLVKGLQVQAFTKGQRHFSDNWDCVGFFTIPIWMGIFAGVVLTLILLVGMFMLSEIKTMDRFDDPKGKHLMTAGAAVE